MKSNIHLPINWTDGVKLTKDHFIDNYFNFITIVSDYNKVHLNNFNYGCTQTASDKSIDIDIKIEAGQLVAYLRKCELIAKNGHLISFNQELYGTNLPEAKINANDLDRNSFEFYYVIVSINPYDLIPVGIPNPNMIPLHHPHVLPEIKLHIVNKKEVNDNFLEGYFLIVKKIAFQNGTFIEDNKYIAPVVKAKNNEILNQFITRINNELYLLNDFSIKIHKKNNQSSANNKLVSNTFSLCSTIINYYGEQCFYLKNIASEEPPVYMFDKIIVLANHLLSSLTLMDDKEKETLLQYYYEWIDVKPSELLSVLFEAKSAVYDHNDISETLDKLNQFLSVLKRLWQKLSELEYIGIRKENIVISEETKTVTPRSNTWSILD
ncbi:hypothetical protein [Flavobacterium kingsejongi]|uniref:Type VI secretion system-associated protein n=1 Tax=Flavobacterium kingsejongi TaxID=1678728 RepID=A0A2S1LPY5_9FLAO|nr:hypothetical protein [Flavobacterium kingsejongi]AWG25817.1 hypothetical protein FK004_11595 [Flavobacterium kingsejongi]